MRRRSVGVVVRGAREIIDGHGPVEVTCDIRVFWPSHATEYDVLRALTQAYGEAADRVARKMKEERFDG